MFFIFYFITFFISAIFLFWTNQYTYLTLMSVSCRKLTVPTLYCLDYNGLFCAKPNEASLIISLWRTKWKRCASVAYLSFTPCLGFATQCLKISNKKFCQLSYDKLLFRITSYKFGLDIYKFSTKYINSR